jgi:DNA (cytosine-5)-methyltransferase 1
MTPTRVLELFAGCGGAALGLHRAGLVHAACVEWDEAAAATLAAAGFPVLRSDVRAVDYRPFQGHVEVVWASPPCQPGSTAGRRRGANDPRDGWPWTFDVLDVVRPTWFLAENVLGWTYHTESCRADGQGHGCVGCAWQGVVLPALRARFAFVSSWVIDAADHGVPQHRRRVLLCAGPLPVARPPATHGDPGDEDTVLRGLSPWVSLSEAVGATLLDPATCDVRACYPCDGSHGRACAEPWRADRPAPTVTTTEVKGTRAHAPEWSFHGGPDRASDTAFLVAGVRRIEVVEGLALQALPVDWPLQGTREEQYRQVGNAVPPPMAEAVGRAVLAAHQALTSLRGRGVDLDALAAALRRRAA